ncbi:TPA: alpha/beta hydrolase, partial [Corynebacterium striatum]|nr:alpha/beta hydrolase [Corynebacterium striatum]
MCVWAFDYGADDVTLQNAIPAMKAIGDLDASASEIAEQIEYVRSATGSDKVNLVGHSQGGLHTKTFTQLYSSPEEVSR